MVPDDMELQHRHICQQARVLNESSLLMTGSSFSLYENKLPSSMRILILGARSLPLKDSVSDLLLYC